MVVLKEKIILGIDPGTNVMGYGLIHCKGQKIKLIQFGVIHLNKYKNHELKLKKIYQRVSELIIEYTPDEVALEAPFYGKNVQSMLKLGRAQGVAMAAGLVYNLPVFEYAPRKVKMAVTGNGNASKEQVARMLEKMLDFSLGNNPLDATDGLSVAVCHYFQGANVSTGSSHKNWSSFLKDNPGRIKKR